MYYVYILRSAKDNKNYAGYTKNLKLRFEEHKKGKMQSTKYRRPLRLIYYECCLNQQDAIKREKYLKTYHDDTDIPVTLKTKSNKEICIDNFGVYSYSRLAAFS